MGLTSAPVEIILYILQSCDSFAELRALFSSCRRIHGIWLENAPRVVWHVAPKVLPGFDWALLAVRATALVHDAHHDGRNLPPEIRPEELTGGLRKPTLDELDSILALHHFVQCVELRYCHDNLTINKAFNDSGNQPHNLWPEDRKPPPPINNNTPEEPGEGMRVWTEQFHTAAYMTFLMGAVLARAYNEPFYPKENIEGAASLGAAEARRKEIWDLMRQAASDRSNERHHRLTINENMREYLRRFPVYDLNNELRGQKKVFGPFVEWFIRYVLMQNNKTIPKPATRDPSRPAVKLEIDRLNAADDVDRCPDLPGNEWMEWPQDGTLLSELFDPKRFAGSPAEVETVVWAAMQTVHMFEFILACVTNLDGTCRLGRSCTCCNDLGRTDGSTLTSATPSSSWIIPSKAVTAKVVLFGIFQAEVMLMQADVKSSIDQQLVAYAPPRHHHAPTSPLSSHPESEGHTHDNDDDDHKYLDIPLVLDDLYNRSGIANEKFNSWRPPPPLQLFMFLLEHHFNLEFGYSLFTTYTDGPQDYWLFRKRATIFAHGPELVPERSVLDYTNGMEFLVPLYPQTLSFCDRGDWYFQDHQHMYHGNPRTWEPDCEYFE